MIKIFKPAILILFHLILLQGINSQIKTNVPDNLRQRFIQYCKTVPREEIFIHLDREEYLAGEALWFNLFLIDRQSFKPSLNSRIAYFELLNSENRPVVQKRILTDRGFGPGQIILPDSLSTGTYTIRAYTNWMKNFLPVNCYMKEIRIYNVSNINAIAENVYSVNNINKEVSRATNTVFNNTGLAIKVDNLKADTLEIFINSNIRFRSENSNTIYLFIQTHGLINHLSTEKITSDDSKISIPKSQLIPGINQLTVFDSGGQPVFERFIYSPDREKRSLSFQSVDSCKKRSKIALNIELGNESATSLNSTNLSISVYPMTDDRKIMDIIDYMVFGTEFGLLPVNMINGGKINSLSPEVIDSILLNVHSNWINWPTILSGDLPHFKYQAEKDDHFLFGKLLANEENADVSDKFLLLCNPGAEAGFQYARTDSEGNFRFNIHIDEELKDLIIMPDDISKNYRIIIESSFSDQYLKAEIAVDSIKRAVSPHISDWSVNYQVGKIYGVTSLGDPMNQLFQPLKQIRFYGKPDIELIMADYIKLPVMEEVFLELLPHVSLRKKKSTYDLSIADRVNDSRYVTTPSLMIDGIIVRNTSLIANLDPEVVEKIDVIKEKYLVGAYFFYGIINIITKSGDFSCVPLPDYMIRLSYRVIDPVLSFRSPDYSSAEINNRRIPDFRNTLFWNPSVKPDRNGKAKVEFWSSDVVTDYMINIQGITKGGELLSIKKIISVK